MSSVSWYWHRLRAMSAAELTSHGRRKLHQFTDNWWAERRFARVRDLAEGGTFPQLPPATKAPEELRAALRRDADEILEGRWIAFGHLPLEVENPPRWHKDYLVGIDLATNQPALKLHHRLEGKADIKLIWELSRWFSIVRLAQAAYVLDDQRAAAQCLAWLNHWLEHNPAYFGWNWTSALESGLRLVQFVWLDALLAGARRVQGGLNPGAKNPPPPPLPDASASWGRLRAGVLPAHLWFTWRNRSFGSSANNHLIGELAGLIVALVRWPQLARWAAPLCTLQHLWEKEVLTQFAPDGGNREQALNYHLFSCEFCWQALLALRAAGRPVSAEVEARLKAAVGFFAAVQSPEQPWDYGDSDSAFVTPLFAEWPQASSEWYRWLVESHRSPSIRYWLGDPPKAEAPASVSSGPGAWQIYPASGYAVCRVAGWFLRWDLSPLGYLATAGHGHCDALHLSVWYEREAIIIDPGTAAYHADRPLRDYLASWEAHNGPHAVHPTFPQRRGAFLWSAQHEGPRWETRSKLSLSAELRLPTGILRRTISYLPAENGWQIDDEHHSMDGSRSEETVVLWQFAPAMCLNAVNNANFRIETRATTFTLGFVGWANIEPGPPGSPGSQTSHQQAPPRGACSSAFRSITTGPYIHLRGTANAPTPLRTSLRPTNSQMK